MTYHQIEKKTESGWEKVGNPFPSSLDAELARLEWLPGVLTRIEHIEIPVEVRR